MSSSPEKVEHYDDDFFQKLGLWKHVYQALADWIAANIDGEVVGDIGCGNADIIHNLLVGHHKTVWGVDGSNVLKQYVDKNVLPFVEVVDITQKMQTKRADTVVCLEVAEHIPYERSDALVENIIASGAQTIVFSAAVPGQIGTNHINLQPKKFWVDKFLGKGYVLNQPLVDKFKLDLLESTKDAPWYVSNILLFNKIAVQEKAPKVSIIIPCFNDGAYVMTALQSAISQTYSNTEIIIVDDGSTDSSTLDVLESIKLNHRNVNVIHQKNKGLAEARNTGIAAASGEYIFPLDSDNKMDSRLLQETVPFLQDKTIGLVYTWLQLFGEVNLVREVPEFDFRQLLVENYIDAAALFRKQDWARIGGYRSNMKYGLEDWDFWISVGELGLRGYCVKKPLMHYCVKKDSMISSLGRDVEKNSEMHNVVFGNHKGTYTSNLNYLYANNTKRLLISSKKIAELSQQLATNETLLREKDTALQERDTKLHQKNLHIDEVEALLHQMHHSLSWKLTAPIRGLSWAVIHPKKAVKKHFIKKLPDSHQEKIWRWTDSVKWAKHNPRRFVKKHLIRKLPYRQQHIVYRVANQVIKTLRLKKVLNRLEGKDDLTKLYQNWIHQHALSAEQIDDQKIQQGQLPYRPKISIVMPVYNTDEHWLRQCIDSVINQTYDNWELCIADDTSTKPHVRRVLDEYQAADPRVKVFYREKNGSISRATNSAFNISTGDYIGLLDSDDELTPNAFFEIVSKLNENRSKTIHYIYTDYAITNEYDEIRDLVFCPDFSRNYFLSHPYIVHLVLVSRAMLDICKGFDDVNFNENVSHDVDFSLRIFARIKDEEVLHVERIVYYWRHHTKSFGVKESQKVSTYSKIAIKRYMDSKSIAGEVVDGPIFNSFRVRPTITGNPLISIIIPTSDKWELLDKCLASIEKNSGYENYEILIVKNNVKTDGAKRYHESLVNRYRVLKYDKEFNYSAINNFAAKEAKGDYLLLLNDDVEFITEDFLKSMLECFEFENIGVVGAKLLYPDNAIQHAGVIIGMNTYADHWQKFEGGYLNASEKIPNPGYIYSLISIRDFSAVTGACLMTPKALYEKIGGLSEDLKVGFNDVDYCLQARELGLKVLCTPYALGYHHEHASRIEVVKNTRNKELINNHEDRKVFGLKWRAVIDAGDPFYNSNLRTDSTVPRPKT